MGKKGIATKFPRNYNNKIYTAWKNMRGRCNNTLSKDYKYYGLRGIKHCEDWKEYAYFEKWALKNGYKENLTLDRINCDGNYEPSNCRWATKTTQSRNTRRLRIDNTSGERGVKRQGKKYEASITINGKTKYIGIFNTTKEAGLAYDNFIIENKLEHTRNYL